MKRGTPGIRIRQPTDGCFVSIMPTLTVPISEPARATIVSPTAYPISAVIHVYTTMTSGITPAAGCGDSVIACSTVAEADSATAALAAT